MSGERTPLLQSAQHKREAPSFFNRCDYALILPVLLSNRFLTEFESTIAASTQPTAGADSSASDNVAWVATSYLMISTAVKPYGRSSDIFGRTTLYILSLSFFAVGCLSCALRASLGQMVIARAICGIGGQTLPIKNRPAYQAVNNITYGVGAAIGASLVGLLFEDGDSHTSSRLPYPSSEGSTIQVKDIDVFGSGLLLTTISLLLMTTINLGGNEISWFSPLVPTSILFTIILAIIFFRHEAKTPLPVLPMGLVNIRHMVSQVGLNLFGDMFIFGVLRVLWWCLLFWESVLPRKR
ncbi:hypothetical protein IAR50_003894 [Cryptococcus sp. DSM 104548]